jgi:hypothetical protein
LKTTILSPSDIKNDLIIFFKNKNLIPILGSGFSCNAKSNMGKVPSGSEYKEHILKCLLDNKQYTPTEREELSNLTFSNLYDQYEDNENVNENVRFTYLKNHFYKVKFDNSDIRKSILDKIDWTYIYSLNLDDAIENTSKYRQVLIPQKEYRWEILGEEKCVIKLHGDIKEIITTLNPNRTLNTQEYAGSLKTNQYLLNKLESDYKNQNIIFIGCSLDDEVDLKAINSSLIKEIVTNDMPTLNKRIIFIKGSVSHLQKIKYKSYGITDIVCFDNFEDMYTLLLDAWNESQSIQTNEIEDYASFKVNHLASDNTQNLEYFFRGDDLLNIVTKQITIPYYFINRKISPDIIKNLNDNKLHLIYGRRISGKSYFLISIYNQLPAKNKYFFNDNIRIPSHVLTQLLNSKKIVVFLDINNITKSQMELILDNVNLINKNKNNFILTINDSDGESTGIIKLKLKYNQLDVNHIVQYNLPNRLEDNDINTINKLLPIAKLPAYTKKRTFLDQIIYAEDSLGNSINNTKYTSVHLEINSDKELALFIIFAVNQKISAFDIINFAFEKEIITIINKYRPLIDRQETLTLEKDALDMSSFKYVLSSNYWLKRELGNFARNKNNYEQLSNAYTYIVEKIKSITGANLYKQRQLCRNYILFETMNNIFLDQFHGNIDLIVYLYEKLHPLLATDFHYLHQKAKACLNYAAKNKISQSEKITYLKKALESISISFSLVTRRYNQTKNERLLISSSHIQYTKAIILCNIYMYGGNDKETLISLIDILGEAINSPYNSENFSKDLQHPIAEDIQKFARKIALNLNDIDLSAESKYKLNNIITQIIM